MAIILILTGIIFLIAGMVLMTGLKVIPELIIEIIISMISGEIQRFTPDIKKVSKTKRIMGIVIVFFGLACFLYGLMSLSPPSA